VVGADLLEEPFDLFVDGDTVTGTMWLSEAVPGQLTCSAGPVSFSVD